MSLLKDDQEKIARMDDYLESIKALLLEQESNDAIEYIKWLYNKTYMRLNPEIEKDFPLFSGGIYYMDLGKNIGSEQEKDRTCILLSGSQASPTVIIIPVSDEEKYKGSTFWFHVSLEAGDTALVEQIRTVSKTRIKRKCYDSQRKIRQVNKDEKIKINEAIEKLKFRLTQKNI